MDQGSIKKTNSLRGFCSWLGPKILHQAIFSFILSFIPGSITDQGSDKKRVGSGFMLRFRLHSKSLLLGTLLFLELNIEFPLARNHSFLAHLVIQIHKHKCGLNIKSTMLIQGKFFTIFYRPIQNYYNRPSSVQFCMEIGVFREERVRYFQRIITPLFWTEILDS